MPDRRYALYDTYIFAAAASTGRLFQTSEGGDAVHVTAFTNSRGAGVLPQSEKFTVDWIGIIEDYIPLIANRVNITIASWFEIIVANVSVLKLPLIMAWAKNGYSGHFTQAVAADLSGLGRLGDGYNMVDHPIVINGGEQFAVVVNQGTAVAAASNVKFVLNGVLSIP
jgi:hypothetical protein